MVIAQVPLDILIFLPIGIAALAILIWQGCLKPHVLNAGPLRKVPLKSTDLLVALGLMGAGMLIVGTLFHYLQLEPTTPLNQAKMALFFQLITHGLILAYMIIRLVPRQQSHTGLGLSLPGFHGLGRGLIALLLGVPILFALNILTVALARWMGFETPAIGHALLSAIRDAKSLHTLTLLLISAVLIAPVFEEIIFRGLVHNALTDLLGQKVRWRIVGLSASLFCAIHLGVAWEVLPALFVLGIILGWLYERTGNLWPGILMHAGFNAINIAVVLAGLQQ